MNMLAKNIRKTILDMAYKGSTVHIGCAFSIVEIVTVLYRNFLKFPDNDPSGLGRDFFVLSKGHGVMAQYACFHELGWLDDDAIDHYFRDGTKLKGLSDSRVSGLEVTSGSLGHGLSVGVGMAYGVKLKQSSQKTYILIGDGEMNEGAVWEGVMFASHHDLKNLMVIVDANGFQAMGPTSDIIELGSIKDKLQAFGFEVAEVDGHNEVAIYNAISSLWLSSSTKPKAVVARTIKGKGVSFMENNNAWHYTRLTEKTYSDAVDEVLEK
ncbi:transketolase [Pseudomonadales bacterium]|nr:transketolase [Pseudomonadales bacterium]